MLRVRWNVPPKEKKSTDRDDVLGEELSVGIADTLTKDSECRGRSRKSPATKRQDLFESRGGKKLVEVIFKVTKIDIVIGTDVSKRPML